MNIENKDRTTEIDFFKTKIPEKKINHNNKINDSTQDLLEAVYYNDPTENNHKLPSLHYSKPINTLDELIDEITEKEITYFKKYTKCKTIYYSTGVIALIINIIITSFSANYNQSNSQIIFVLSILSSIIISVLNFLQIETKITKFQNFTKIYRDLRFEIHNFQSIENSDEEIDNFLTLLLKKYRKIHFQSLEVDVVCYF